MCRRLAQAEKENIKRTVFLARAGSQRDKDA